MNIESVIIYALVSFLTSIFSGMSGGGGGFINTPLLIFLGLSPAQAVSSGKFVGLSVAVGSLGGMRQAQSRQLLRRALPIIGLAVVVGLLAPFVIRNLNNGIYQRALGALLLLMIPVLLIKKVGFKQQPTSKSKTYLGAVLLALALWLQAIFSSGLGTLVNVVLMGMLGMTALEANVTKRYSQLVLNVTIVLGVLTSGLIVWQVASVGIVMTLLGSYLGGKIAVKKGDKFVTTMFIIAMGISGLLLLAGVS